MRHTFIVGVHLVFRIEGRVLLGLRRGPFADGCWHVPAGHLEDESMRRCAIREAREELGVTITEDRLQLVHTLHDRDEDDGHTRIQHFFAVRAYTGRIHNTEPDKCRRLRWWPLDALPANTVPYTVRALAAITAGSAYSETGWPV